MPMQVRHSWVVAMAAGLILGLCSCSSRPRLQPIRGQVFVDGKPAAGAIVVLHPVHSAAAAPPACLPAARVQADGSFELGSFAPGDGAPAGEYAVAISWVDDGPQNSKAPKTAKLQPRYADARSTPLRATIAPGTTELPAFNLPK